MRRVGDRIQATVVSTTGASRSRAGWQRGAATRAADRRRVSRADCPWKARSRRQVKGGYTVARRPAARLLSWLADRHGPRASIRPSHIGRVYAFRIIEYREDGRKFVVSRRALLEEEQKARAVEVRAALVPSARS